MKITWLQATNWILQFLCIRLTRCTEDTCIGKQEIGAYQLSNPDSHNDVFLPGCFDKSIKEGGPRSIKYLVNHYTKLQWYAIQYWIVPLSGWYGPFNYMNKSGEPEFKRITKKKPLYERYQYAPTN